MAFTPAPGEQYTVRRKILTVLGASFHVYDASGKVVGFCRQKAFKLREDLRLFTDESQSNELFRMRARQVLDWGVTFDVTLPTGESIGSIRRKGMKSILRDEWILFDEHNAQIGHIQEDSGFKAMMRRTLEYAAMLLPQRFHVRAMDGRDVAVFRQHFNPMVYRLGVAIKHTDEQFDELLILASACLIAAIEGRQG